jgi:hypothetical protein
MHLGALAFLAAAALFAPPPLPASPADTHVFVNTMPTELGVGSRVQVQFIGLNYSDIEWDSTNAYLAVLKDPAGLFPTKKIPLPAGVTVGYIRQCCMTASLTAPATPQDCPVELQMMKSTGVAMGLKFSSTVRVRASARLSASALSLNPLKLLPGMGATASFTVTNGGTAASPAQAFQVWGSPDQTFWSTSSTALGGWQRSAVAAGQPSARSEAAMVYDEGRGRVILFGGTNGETYFAETWEYTPPGQGPLPGWRKLTGSAPPGRSGHVMAYDAAHGKVILFGGFNGKTVLADTWEYTATGGWRMVPPSATTPSARQRAAMAYDRKRQTVFLFGGVGDGYPVADEYPLDSWVYASGQGWQQLQTPAAPSGRERHALAYDSRKDRILMLDGRGFGLLGDMWQYTYPAGWTRLPDPALTPREGHVLIYDPRRDRLVLFGGWDADYCGETWEWRDALGWRKLRTLGPTTRNLCAAAYDHILGLDFA